jgi:PAS domain S-box-containing protein
VPLRSFANELSAANRNDIVRTGVLVFAAATLSYVAGRLGGVSIPHTRSVGPLWAGCTFLLSGAAFCMMLAVLEAHKRSQETLRLTFRHAAILESSGDAIIYKTLDGMILSWNAGAQRLFGFTEAEAIWQPITILIPTEMHDEESTILQRLRAGEHIEQYETIRTTKSANKINVSLTLCPIRDSENALVGIVTIARDITEQKRAMQDLRESEERFRLVADKAPVMIWMADTDKQCTFFNAAWVDFTGQSMEHELGEGWSSGVHPDDVERCLAVYSDAFDARADFEMEYRLRRFDGRYRWIVDYGVPRIKSDGTFGGYIGSCVDVTDRKLTEASLTELSGRLICAQEAERTRIARELHDDFSQRLALHGIGLGQLWNSLPASDVVARGKVREMLKKNREMSTDMHSLSHQLHSSRLEHVGLASALAGLCEEMTAKHLISIEFAECEISCTIPKDVALCFFRIAQEALGNVIKHSQSKHAHV